MSENLLGAVMLGINGEGRGIYVHPLLQCIVRCSVELFMDEKGEVNSGVTRGLHSPSCIDPPCIIVIIRKPSLQAEGGWGYKNLCHLYSRNILWPSH